MMKPPNEQLHVALILGSAGDAFVVIESVWVPHTAYVLRGLISRTKAAVSGGEGDPPSIISLVIFSLL